MCMCQYKSKCTFLTNMTKNLIEELQACRCRTYSAESTRRYNIPVYPLFTIYQSRINPLFTINYAKQGRIQDFHLGGGGRCPLWPGSMARLTALEALGVFDACCLSLIVKHSDTKWGGGGTQSIKF